MTKVSISSEFDTAIYTTKDKSPDIVNIKVFYGNGYDDLIEIRKAQGEIDYDQTIKEFDQYKKAGIGKYDKIPQVITVNGITGWGSEPGYNIVDGLKYPRPGFVSWRDNGVEYIIYGTKGENGHSLQQLLKVANSIYE